MKLTGSLTIDARLVPCPRCGERSGAPCFTQSGNVASDVHTERYTLLTMLFNPQVWHINSEARRALLTRQQPIQSFRMPLDLEV